MRQRNEPLRRSVGNRSTAEVAASANFGEGKAATASVVDGGMVARVPLLGVGVSALDMERALDQFRVWQDTPGTRTYVCVTPAHSLMDCRDDVELTSIYNSAGMVTPDGMAVVWLLNLHGHREVRRVYGPDLLDAACEVGVDHGWRHYFLGGTDVVLDNLVTRLTAKHRGLSVAGRHAPPFRTLTEEEEQSIIDGINAAKPDFLWVGLGSPSQERWMSLHRDVLDVPVMLGVGAAFDFLSGNKPQAPRRVQRAGLEWLYRLFHEPRRLWPRYRRYPLFVALAGYELLRERMSRSTPRASRTNRAT